MPIMPYHPATRSNVALAKGSPFTLPLNKAAARDKLRPGKRLNADQGRDDPFSFLTLEAERQRIARLWSTYHGDIDIFAMVRQVMRRVPPWELQETEFGKGAEANERLLLDFFHRPDGTNSCQAILRSTIARLKMIGNAYWLLRYVGDEDDAGGGEALAKMRGPVAEEVADRTGMTKAEVIGIMEGALSGTQPIGFEYLEGAVRYDGKDGVWKQAVSSGQPKTYRPERVIEFKSLDPAGGVLSELRWLEPWSDASVQTFILNRDGVRTGGMADKLIVLYGVSAKEAIRIEGYMADRADPARTEDTWLPIVTHATAAIEGQRLGVDSVELSSKGRDAQHGQFDETLRIRKSGVTGVPLSTVSEYRSVNRANMAEDNRKLIEHEIWPDCTDMAVAITENVIVEYFGITDWQFGFEKPDTRGQELAHKQDIEDLRSGVTTPYNYWVQVHGKAATEEMLKEIAAAGGDVELTKVPWYVSGGQWTPMTDIIGEVSTEGAKAPASPALPLPVSPEAEEEAGAGQEGAEAGRTQPAPEQLERALDIWQKAATEVFRKTGAAYDPGASNVAAQMLPRQMYEYVDRRLWSAQSVPEISMAFKDARAVIQRAASTLEKVEVPQSLLRHMTDTMEEIFAARNRDARVIVRAAAEDEEPFETEPVPQEEGQ